MHFAGKYHLRTNNITNDDMIEKILNSFVWVAMFPIPMFKIVTKINKFEIFAAQ
jgi:hypothetical protein